MFLVSAGAVEANLRVLPLLYLAQQRQQSAASRQLPQGEDFSSQLLAITNEDMNEMPALVFQRMQHSFLEQPLPIIQHFETNRVFRMFAFILI